MGQPAIWTTACRYEYANRVPENQSVRGGIMVRGGILIATIALGLSAAVDGAVGQETVKIGFILPMTGQQQSTGKQIELIIRDDAAVPDNTKRIAQELIVNEKVAVVAGFGVTPAALSVAPL